jgi:hypothetical protein
VLSFGGRILGAGTQQASRAGGDQEMFHHAGSLLYCRENRSGEYIPDNVQNM